jgi:arabinofuranosyltransferase
VHPRDCHLTSASGLGGKPSRVPLASRLLGGAVLAIAVAILAVHARRFYPLFPDDAFISLRYAARLLDGKGLTWTDGEWVEGYSNLLWVLACAALGALGFDLITAAHVLGFAGMAATLVALLYRYWPRSPATVLPPLGGCLFLACSGTIAVWASAGLEQPLVAALLAWGVALCLPILECPDPRAFLLPGLFFGLLAVTRPDGVLFAGTAALAILLTGRFRSPARRQATSFLAISALCIAAQLVFRLLYYGDWLPNTAYAKIAPSRYHLWLGWFYVQLGATYLKGALLPSALGLGICAWVPALRSRAWFLALPILAWTAYIIGLGGDIFVAHRHFVPILVLSAFMFAEGCSWLLRTRQWWLHAGAWAVVALGLILLFIDEGKDPRFLRALTERWEWDSQVLGLLFREAFEPEHPLLAVEAAGSLPYFSRLPTLDLFGLTDRHIAHHRPVAMGQGPIAHELGDAEYALQRQPDLIVFCHGTEPCSQSDKAIQTDPRFAREYVPVNFLGTTPHPVQGLAYVRIRSPRIGMRQQGSRLHIPGFLFSRGKFTARMDRDRQLALVVPPGSAARFDAVDFPEGEWHLVAVPDALYRVLVFSHDDHRQFSADETVHGRVDIEIRPAGGWASVREVAFERF